MGKGFAFSHLRKKLPTLTTSDSEFSFTYSRQKEQKINHPEAVKDNGDQGIRAEVPKRADSAISSFTNNAPSFFPENSDSDEPSATKGARFYGKRSYDSWVKDSKKKYRRREEASEKRENEGCQGAISDEDKEAHPSVLTGFVTALDKLSSSSRTLASARTVRSGFVPPVRSTGQVPSKNFRGVMASDVNGSGSGSAMAGITGSKKENVEELWSKCLEGLGLDPSNGIPDALKNLEPRLIDHIANEIMLKDTGISWEDIAGLEHAKRCVMEMVIWPLKRPDLFQGTRAPGKGLLLYGPPGTGKTLIGKAIAGESKATFFSISASSLTSKWIGEGEKLVRALFGVASCLQPAVIFIDEIDSLLSQRKEDGEHESSRRLKTQFLVEMEGCGGGNEQVLLIGATNRPQELDPAVRRRMSNRLYIPLPEEVARSQIVRKMLLKDGLLSLSEKEIQAIAKETEGYSGSDMKCVVKEASMEPLREAMACGVIAKVKKEDIRPLNMHDFRKAIKSVRPSVAPEELHIYKEWSKQFGGGDKI